MDNTDIKNLINTFLKENKLENGLLDLEVKKVVGMHWGTAILSLEPIWEPSIRFKTNAEKFGYKKAQTISKEIDHFFILIDKNTKKIDINHIIKDFLVKENYTIIETKSDQFDYRSKNIKVNHNLDRDILLKKIRINAIHKRYISSKKTVIDFNLEEIDFLEKILEYEHDIMQETDILITAQNIRNILDDFSYEFGYINNEDVYDRVFSNFCIGK